MTRRTEISTVSFLRFLHTVISPLVHTVLRSSDSNYSNGATAGLNFVLSEIPYLPELRECDAVLLRPAVALGQCHSPFGSVFSLFEPSGSVQHEYILPVAEINLFAVTGLCG